MTHRHPKPALTLITMLLPGPDRKRTPAAYHFRMTYRNPVPAEPGCVMTWEVRGGRELYQISLERTASDDHRWHCTCPDAVYHGEDRAAYQCKHVRGLVDLFETIGDPVRRVPATAA